MVNQSTLPDRDDPASAGREGKANANGETPGGSMKVFFDSMDEVPKHLKNNATEDDEGSVVVEVENAEELHDISGLKSALDSEREARRQAEQEAKKFEGLDPEKAKSALKKLQDLDEKKLLEQGKVDELLEQRTQKMRADFEGQLESLKERSKGLEEQLAIKDSVLNEVVIDTSVTKAFDRLGLKVKKGALEDVFFRARKTWKLGEDGKPLAMEDDKKIYGSDGTSPLSLDEWATGLFKQASHLFDDSAGGGSPKAGGDSSPGGAKSISRSDTKAFGENLEAIAKGEVMVTD